jgi:coiled-coil and C2 domain-containing protein 2A
VFIPKFLTPLKPYETLYGGRSDKNGIEKVARFVSLIPYLDDSTLFKDMPDLACTSQQFLDLGMGDSEEHAILLCNYFNYIDRD